MCVCACIITGVTDDPQMNAMSKIALEFAVEASSVVGTPAPPIWGQIAAHLELRCVPLQRIILAPFAPDLI